MVDINIEKYNTFAKEYLYSKYFFIVILYSMFILLYYLYSLMIIPVENSLYIDLVTLVVFKAKTAHLSAIYIFYVILIQ